jgi:hypothetical protein
MALLPQQEGALSVLPLTIDFLSNKWHENEVLRKQVIKRLADAIISSDVEGILLNLPRDQRVSVLQQGAESLRREGNLKRADQLITLALQWSEDPALKFLKGRILHEGRNKTQGMYYMRIALAELPKNEQLIEERVYLAMALASSKSNTDSVEALRIFEDYLPRSIKLNIAIVEEFLKLALELREFRAIARVLGRIDKPQYLYWMVKFLLPSTHNNSAFLFTCGDSIIRALRASMRSREITKDETLLFRQEASRIEATLSKQ